LIDFSISPFDEISLRPLSPVFDIIVLARPLSLLADIYMHQAEHWEAVPFPIVCNGICRPQPSFHHHQSPNVALKAFSSVIGM